MSFPLLIYRVKGSIFICYEREREKDREKVYLEDNIAHSFQLFANLGSYQREITSTNRIENEQRTLSITTLMMFENIYFSTKKDIEAQFTAQKEPEEKREDNTSQRKQHRHSKDQHIQTRLEHVSQR